MCRLICILLRFFFIGCHGNVTEKIVGCMQNVPAVHPVVEQNSLDFKKLFKQVHYYFKGDTFFQDRHQPVPTHSFQLPERNIPCGGTFLERLCDTLLKQHMKILNTATEYK